MKECKVCGSVVLSTGVCSNPLCKGSTNEIEKVSIDTSGSVTYDDHAKRLFASRVCLKIKKCTKRLFISPLSW